MARRARFFAINPNKKNVNQDYDEPLLPPDSPQMTELSVNNDISRSFPARYRYDLILFYFIFMIIFILNKTKINKNNPDEFC